MPSGPKKRQAARRRSMKKDDFLTSLDKESMTGSHASDEGTSPKTSNDVNPKLLLSTGPSESLGDQTFHTEEWVRVSDFDVGTPTSTTAKSDYDAAAEESYGDARAHDKLVDWETLSRDNVENSSSAEDVGEAENVVVEYSSGSGLDQGQKSPNVDEVSPDLPVSDMEDAAKSVSSRSGIGKSSHTSSSSDRSSKSTGHILEAHSKKSDNEERLSSIVVVPSQDDSQESSYVEVASVGAQDDGQHGGVENQARRDEPALLNDHEEETYESFSGPQDQAITTIEPHSTEDVSDVDKTGVEYSSGSGQNQGQNVDEAFPDMSVSDKEDDAKSVSSGSDIGKSSHSSSSSSRSSKSTGHNLEADSKKADDEDNLAINCQSLVEVISAIDDSKPLEGGDLKDLQHAAAEEVPLLKDSFPSINSGLQTGLKVRAPELYIKESEDDLLEESNSGSGGKHSNNLSMQAEKPPLDEVARNEQQFPDDKSGGAFSVSIDQGQSLESKVLPIKTEEGSLVPFSSIINSEVLKSSAEFTKDVDRMREVGDLQGNLTKSQLYHVAKARSR